MLLNIWVLNQCLIKQQFYNTERRNEFFLLTVNISFQSAESPCKRIETPPKPKKVGISQIASVVAEVYGSRLVAGPGVEQPTIPLQQKLLICTFLLMTKERNTKEVVLGKVNKLRKNMFTLGLANNNYLSVFMHCEPALDTLRILQTYNPRLEFFYHSACIAEL